MPTESAYARSAHRVRESYDASREMVEEHPLSTALTVFGLGFGLGLVIGVMLSEPEPTYANRWDRYGKQVVDAVYRAVPDAIAKRMG